MPEDLFTPPGNRLVFTFATQKAADHFKAWLCESGEQAYWEWMRYREEDDEDGSITALRFLYHTGTEEIQTECGRLEKEARDSTDSSID